MIETGLKGKVVVVTGASSGIGKATALRFAQEGCRVAAWDILPSDAFPGGLFRQVDIGDTSQVAAAAEEVGTVLGGVDVLINNAGILRDGQIVKYKDGGIAGLMSDEQFDAVVNVNLKGVFACSRAVIPMMVAGGGGAILNASSVVGIYGNFGQTNYVAAKSGVIGMTKVWARELGKYGIRVNAVAPGFIETEMVKAMPAKVLDSMRAHTPLGRMGTPADIANAYLWLASDAASFITGAVISVDGGIVTGT